MKSPFCPSVGDRGPVDSSANPSRKAGEAPEERHARARNPLAWEFERTVEELSAPDPCIRCQQVTVHYGDKPALRQITLEVGRCEILALIGPSGCGKSTLLRCLNRMNDVIPGCCVRGEILIDGENIQQSSIDVGRLRKRVGMVFQKPNPFPGSIYENVAYGPRMHGLASCRTDLDKRVEKALRRVGLWKEVKDDLQAPGTSLSGGQQQRLCIARTLAVDPEIILMDEPCFGLDAIATDRIEDLMSELRRQLTLVIVTHSLQQAARVAQRTAYLHLGRLVEVGKTAELFTCPRDALTEDYLTGRFG